MKNSVILRKRNDNIEVLTLNRPDKLNALDYNTIDTLHATLDEMEADQRCRVVIITGAGDRAFSAGADIPGFSESVRGGAEQALREFVRRGQRLTSRIETFTKPIIMAVNGLAYGGGCEITEAAPLAVASDRARFAKPEIKLGFPPPFGGTQRLPRLIGRKRALAMILTADSISADEAARIGLVNKVVPHTELLDEARRMAERICMHSPLAVTASLRSVTRGINLPIDEGLAVEAAQFASLVSTHDIEEGIAAFVERRQPVFMGR